MKKYKTVDLFAGAGGLSYGFLSTGKYNIVAAAEINEDAMKTYLKNITKDNDFEMISNVVGFDFTKLNDRFKGIDVVIGGPPCQGFSNANRHRNHLISTNNSLIKEFFRAIKEIHPKAFVMENVSMLKSDKHRFYESSKDKEEIDLLIESGFSISHRKDSVFVSPVVYDELDINDLSKSLDRSLPEKLFHLLSVLLKNMSNPNRLEKFLGKNRKGIINLVSNYFSNAERSSNDADRLNVIIECLKQNRISDCKEDLSYVVGLQRTIKTIREITDNKLIGEYYVNENGELMFSANSYSVIEYVNAVLGGEYIQIGNTICAENFGVPQERKRYIVMGVRKDICKSKEIALPSGNVDQRTNTVMDAIADLQKYVPFNSNEAAEIMYEGDEELSTYAKEMRRDSTSIKNHIVTKTTKKALDRYRMIKQGNNFHSLPLEQKDTYSKPERTQNTIYLRLDPNKPCGTVVNVRKSMWIHPNLDRAISVREAARLQSFPDVFEFVGTKDSQYQQVGNAVPPLMAEAIAKNLLKYL